MNKQSTNHKYLKLNETGIPRQKKGVLEKVAEAGIGTEKTADVV